MLISRYLHFQKISSKTKKIQKLENLKKNRKFGFFEFFSNLSIFLNTGDIERGGLKFDNHYLSDTIGKTKTRSTFQMMFVTATSLPC